MHATWTDNTGHPHPLKIDGATAKRLLRECDINLLTCLVDTGHIQKIIQRLADEPEVLMAACACCEGIDPKAQDHYFSLWDGDAFQTASVALLEAIADFFPVRPRQILTTLISKMIEAAEMVSGKALTAVMKQLEETDFSSVVDRSQTRGGGGTGSAESSATGQKRSPSGNFYGGGKESRITNS
jgi:hypothetical protein